MKKKLSSVLTPVALTKFGVWKLGKDPPARLEFLAPHHQKDDLIQIYVRGKCFLISFNSWRQNRSCEGK